MRVLLADENSDRSAALIQKLGESGIHEIVRLEKGQSLTEAVSLSSPDIVIVDMARADRDGLEGVRQVSEQQPRPIVMFVDQDDASFMSDAIAAGVSSYNVVGAAIPDIKPIVQTAVAIFDRFQKMSDELSIARTQLSERSIIDQAKTMIMAERKVTEPQAYNWLRKTAMNSGKKIVDIAQDFVRKSKQK